MFNTYSKDKTAIAFSIFILLQRSLVEVMLNIFLWAIPLNIQKVLAKGKPKMEDILALPLPTIEQGRRWVVYLDVVRQWEVLQITTEGYLQHRVGKLRELCRFKHAKKRWPGSTRPAK